MVTGDGGDRAAAGESAGCLTVSGRHRGGAPGDARRRVTELLPS